jgi:hypothetical protein
VNLHTDELFSSRCLKRCTLIADDARLHQTVFDILHKSRWPALNTLRLHLANESLPNSDTYAETLDPAEAFTEFDLHLRFPLLKSVGVVFQPQPVGFEQGLDDFFLHQLISSFRFLRVVNERKMLKLNGLPIDALQM